MMKEATSVTRAGATCKSCGSDQTVLRFRFPDDAYAPGAEAEWELACMSCEESVGGMMPLSGPQDGVMKMIGTKFDYDQRRGH